MALRLAELKFDPVVRNHHGVGDNIRRKRLAQRRVGGEQLRQLQQKPAGGEEVIALPVHHGQIHLLRLDGAHDLHARGIGVFVVEHVGVIREIKISVEVHLAPPRVGVAAREIVLRQRPLQILPDGDVDQREIQRRLLARQLPVQRRAQHDKRREPQQDRPFIIGEDVVELLPPAHLSKSRPMGGFFLFRQLHGVSPSSPGALPSASGSASRSSGVPEEAMRMLLSSHALMRAHSPSPKMISGVNHATTTKNIAK